MCRVLVPCLRCLSLSAVHLPELPPLPSFFGSSLEGSTYPAQLSSNSTRGEASLDPPETVPSPPSLSSLHSVQTLHGPSTV